ncbi:MAG: response regulator [Smithellaceae bacterium]|nr:response regulator [Smithellaceae bacterium]
MSYKILVVEDNPQNRMLLRDVLLFHGFETMEAENGQQGLEMARKFKPDLILMDIQMPLMDGVTAGKILKEDAATRGIKLIALTSFAMMGDRERFTEAGFDGYISKPVDTRALSDMIREMLAAG